ncbi:hypothetical protein JMJ77_0013231, partial [Colletotrichum scovillei]
AVRCSRSTDHGAVASLVRYPDTPAVGRGYFHVFVVLIDASASCPFPALRWLCSVRYGTSCGH